MAVWWVPNAIVKAVVVSTASRARDIGIGTIQAACQTDGLSQGVLQAQLVSSVIICVENCVCLFFYCSN